MKSIATAFSGSDLVKVLTNTISVGQSPNDMEAADLNSDGNIDLVSANFGSNDVSVMLNNCQLASGNLFDYDGDRRTDYAIFRPSTESYYVASLSQNTAAQVFGRPTDRLVPADYNGDGLTDFGFYRKGNWHIVDRFSNPIYYTQFGLEDDITVPADYDGDGKADQAVWRPSNSVWYVRKSSDNGFIIVNFGLSDDVPVIGDFEGDGKYDFAVWRPSDGVWYVRKSSDNGTIFYPYGLMEDLPTPSAYVR